MKMLGSLKERRRFQMSDAFQLWFVIGLVLVATGRAVHAEVPEPDNIVFGQVTLGQLAVTASATNVVIEARKTASGPLISRYVMGSNPAFGNFYSLPVTLEAFYPLTDTNAHRVGGLVYLTVRDDSGVREQRTISIPSRGQFVRLDFTELDSDGDGLPDRWELQYFGGPTGANPNADPDGDGRNNLREYQERTNPLNPDGRHPADAAPADYHLTLQEVSPYVEAWQAGNLWPAAPTNIPIAYVTRAAALALNGGHYAFTNAPPTNAPLSWVPASPLPALAFPGSTNRLLSLNLPESVPPGRPLTVTIRVTPRLSTLAYAVQDTIPTDWLVESVSHGGNYDHQTRQIRWGPFLDDGERDLSYTIISPPTAAGSISLNGIGSFDGFDVVFSENRTVFVGFGNRPRWVLATTDANGPSFQLAGAPSAAYRIESSTNLLTWQFFSSVTTGPNGIYSFHPPTAGQAPQRYFRARSP
jgi:hypothetical protein